MHARENGAAGEIVRYERGEDGIAVLTWDAPQRPVNVLNDASIASFAAAVDRVLADDAAIGAVLVSAKADWIVGADLEHLGGDDLAGIATNVDRFHALLRRIETGGKPFVAALNGSALGGGCEIALALHRRIAASHPKARFGCPEVTLGVLPAGGGTQRMPRTIGIAAALPLLLEGTTLRFERARELRLIDEIVEPAALLESAKAWIRTKPSATRPWDEKTYRLPGGTPKDAKIAELFSGAAAMLRKKTWGNYPAAHAILSCVFEGTQVPLDAGLRIEARAFRVLLRAPETRAMIRTLFFSMGRANALVARPAGYPRATIRTVGVLGAGMMGAGIAFVTAESGARVVLVDRDLETTTRGKALAERLLGERMAKGTIAEADALAILARIEPAVDYGTLAEADLIVEAVFEDRAIKADVTRRAEAVLPARAVFGSNTSTLPIGGLARASLRPERFIGIHFFSPVEKMPLVEVIRGAATSDETLALVLDYVKSIRKTPIVVNDSRGFFTSRVFSTYVNEGLAMLQEGVTPALIENGARMAGMAVGPLAVADEVNFELLQHVMRQTQSDLGAAYVPTIADATIARFAGPLDRPGKRQGRGVYEYPPGDKKHLWSGLAGIFPPATEQPDVEVVKQRLLTVQSVESLRSLAEGVLDDPAMGDVGSILGWGFPSFTGGVFSYVEYVGRDAFAARCAAFAERYGERFALPERPYVPAARVARAGA